MVPFFCTPLEITSDLLVKMYFNVQVVLLRKYIVPYTMLFLSHSFPPPHVVFIFENERRYYSDC